MTGIAEIGEKPVYDGALHRAGVTGTSERDGSSIDAKSDGDLGWGHDVSLQEDGYDGDKLRMASGRPLC